MPQRLLTLALLSLAAASGARDASALGFGRAQPSATLGAPLDFSVSMRLDSGEVLLPECVFAEVTVGDTQLPRVAVGASVESGGGVPSIRVRTRPNIDEPVVAVVVTAGCEAKISRRFTLFADPPGLGLPAPMALDVDATPSLLAAAPAVTAARELTPLAAPDGGERVAPATAPLPSLEAALPTLPATPAAVARDKAPLAAQAPRPRLAAARQRLAARQGPTAAGPRLRLEPASVLVAAAQAAAAASAAEREAAALAAEQAAAQVASAAQAAAAASARVAVLEAGIDTLQRDAQANREQIARLGLALAESESRSRWAPWLLAALVALLGAAGWLWLKLRATRAERDKVWWNGPPVQADAVAQEPPAPDAPVSAWPPAVAATRTPPARTLAPEPATQITLPLSQALLVPDPPTRDVSIEELLDLEQQAEFFIVLGQDEAAIDLLVGHLRSSGGTSPLPYLKLMDIYRRRGEEATYERTRGRFNHRFNAVAPAWAGDSGSGRTLEDYTDVMRQLQRSWPRTVDAMADLETLLFRTDRRELFDLPAYRDVLFLYALARDLLEQGDRNAPRIDVLLPIGNGAGFADTGTRPTLGEETALPTPVDVVLDEPPTAPVDLDLSEPTIARATSQFGFFETAQSKTGQPG